MTVIRKTDLRILSGETMVRVTQFIMRTSAMTEMIRNCNSVTAITTVFPLTALKTSVI